MIFWHFPIVMSWPQLGILWDKSVLCLRYNLITISMFSIAVCVFTQWETCEYRDISSNSVLRAVVSSMKVLRRGSQSQSVVWNLLCPSITVTRLPNISYQQYITGGRIMMAVVINKFSSCIILSCLGIKANFYIYQMFELCKKVEVYNIYNNYYYYGSPAVSTQPLRQKFPMHLLKPSPISTLRSNKNCKSKKSKKGIRLSMTMNSIQCPQPNSDDRPIANIQMQRFRVQQCRPSVILCKDEFSRLRTDAGENGPAFLNRQAKPVHLKNHQNIVKESCHPEKIQAKLKPNCHVRSFSNQRDDNKTNLSSLVLQKQVTQSEATKTLSDTKPVSSKIETTYTNNQLFSSQYIASKYEPQNCNIIRQSFQGSSSKLISISKSFSSVHETVNDKDFKKLQLESEVSRSGKEISINLSNIFSKQQAFGIDCRRSNRETPAKKLNLWQDLERHTIESRFSKECELGEEMDIRIEESLIQDHNPKENFRIFEFNQIRKKDYVMSQALENNLHMIVSLKEFLSTDPRLVVEEIYVYELIEKYFSNSEEYCNILELYQVQRSEGTHILIKQPYQISLQARLKQVGVEQGLKLRERSKSIGSLLLQFLQKHRVFPTRKMTTHDFVVCWNEPKIHDLSFFKALGAQVMAKEEVLAGIDI